MVTLDEASEPGIAASDAAFALEEAVAASLDEDREMSAEEREAYLEKQRRKREIQQALEEFQ